MITRPRQATATAAVTAAVASRRTASSAVYTPQSFGGSHASASFELQSGVSIERQYLGRKTLSASAPAVKSAPAQRRRRREFGDEADLVCAPPSPLVRVSRYFGARVLHVEHAAGGNKLDGALLDALRQRLAQMEGNPAITLIVLSGTDRLFCTGSDLDALVAAAAPTATDEMRRDAMRRLRDTARLAHLISTCVKPVVSVVGGAALGSGAAVALASAYPYVDDGALVSFPEARRGLVPHGGASYFLSRLGGGLGMYLALTGAALRGRECYWSGLVPLYGGARAAQEIAEAAGDLSSDPRVVNGDFARDDVARKALALLRSSRDDEKMARTLEGMHEDVSVEAFERYLALKRWYGYMAAGDTASADAVWAIGEADTGVTPGDLFDFNDGEAVAGRDEVAEPTAAAAAHRARLGALTAYAAAMRDGQLDGGPPRSLLARLAMIRDAFGSSSSGAGTGASSRRAPVEAAPPPARAAHGALVAAAVAAARAAGPLTSAPASAGVATHGSSSSGGGSWESRLPRPLEQLLMRVYEVAEATPLRTELDGIASAVREGVPMAWAAGGVLTPLQVAALGAAHSVPERTSAPGGGPAPRHIVELAVSYVTAKLHGLRSPWVLVDPALLATVRIDAGAPDSADAVFGSGLVAAGGATRGSVGDASTLTPGVETLSDALAKLGLTMGISPGGGRPGATSTSTPPGRLVLVDDEGSEYTPRLVTNLDGLEYGATEEDVFWDLWRGGEADPGPGYGRAASAPLTLALTRAAIVGAAPALGIIRARHGSRAAELATASRASLLSNLAWLHGAPQAYADTLAAAAAVLPRNARGVAAATKPLRGAAAADALAEMSSAAHAVSRAVVSLAAEGAGRRLRDEELDLLALVDAAGDVEAAEELLTMKGAPAGAAGAAAGVAAVPTLKQGGGGAVLEATAAGDGGQPAPGAPINVNLARLARKWRSVINELTALRASPAPPATAAAGLAAAASHAASASRVTAVIPAPPSSAAPNAANLVLRADAIEELSASIRAYAAAEARLLGRRAVAAAVASARASAGTVVAGGAGAGVVEPWDARHSQYELGVDPVSGAVALLRRELLLQSDGATAGDAAAGAADSGMRPMSQAEVAALAAARRGDDAADAAASTGSTSSTRYVDRAAPCHATPATLPRDRRRTSDTRAHSRLPTPASRLQCRARCRADAIERRTVPLRLGRRRRRQWRRRSRCCSGAAAVRRAPCATRAHGSRVPRRRLQHAAHARHARGSAARGRHVPRRG